MTSLLRILSGVTSAVTVGLLLASPLGAQADVPQDKPAQNKPDADGAIKVPANRTARDPMQGGIDRPPILVPADRDEATTKVLLRGLEAQPADGDLEAGLVTTSQQSTFLARPSVTVMAVHLADGGTDSNDGAAKPRDYLAQLKIDGLVAFGESSTPLLYKGRQVEVLRFSKPGLVAKPPVGDAFVAYEGQPLSILLENPSTFAYGVVRARLRFENQDVCLFSAENFGQATHPVADQSSTDFRDKRQWWKRWLSPQPPPSCDANAEWTQFEIPQYTHVSLRTANPSSSWFLDPSTHYARSAKRKGWLTLRFQNADSPRIQEQNLPIEFQFEPATGALLKTLFLVFVPLAAGAALSLVLRVTIPNIKRRTILKDQLKDASKTISTISAEVDSNLRVLLRVERRMLDELRVAVNPFGPGYADYAKRVEQGLPTLKRRIDAVRRLDAALTRRKTLAEQSAVPTRLEQLGEILSAASEILKQDQLSEEDWVFVNQRIEGAEKLLREPTQTEKEAFEAMLAGRWKFLRKHFGYEKGAPTIPDALKGMEECLPDSSLLPEGEDATQWIRDIGVVKADLQLSALALAWEFQFLGPAMSRHPGDQRWPGAKDTLKCLLATPAVENLREAKRLLRQLAEAVFEEDITNALQRGGAIIVKDPDITRPDQTNRFSVRFRQANLNTAAARELVSCHWTFTDTPKLRKRQLIAQWWRARRQPTTPAAKPQPTDPASERIQRIPLTEDGWHVHHYFEGDVARSTAAVRFYTSKGDPIDLRPSEAWPAMMVTPQPSPREEKWQRFGIELTQVGAALLVPLATLASTTISGGTSGHWWELIAIGFGSDTVKNMLVGKDESPPSTQGTVTK